MRIADRYKILFIAFVVLGLFYPGLFAGTNSVDDFNMFMRLEDLDRLDPFSLFLPNTGFYYRPLLMLTFYFDRLVWGQAPSFYHLENMLLHAANATLVFFLARQALADSDLKKYQIPLLAALLFAVHPINTESVNWISGRTDILATFFVLLSTLALFKGLARRRLGWIFVSSVIFVCAVMSKEMVLFFIVAAGFLIWRRSSEQAEGGKGLSTFRDRALAVFFAPYLLGACAYLAMRFMRYAGHDAGFNHLLNHYRYDLLNTIRVSLKVFGFYVKKLFVPVPLNFTITQASDLYVFLGLAAVALVFLLLRRRGMNAQFLLVSLLMIAPAILIALVQVAWTPLAERYLYLPSAFFAIAMAGVIGHISKQVNLRVLTAGVFVLLISATAVTAQRNRLWQDNLALYKDVHSKSAHFAASYNELAIALMEEGKLDEAESRLLEGEQKFGTRQPLLYVNHARLELMRKDPEAAREILLEAIEDKSSANIEVLKMLARVDENRLMAGGEMGVVGPDLVDTYANIVQRVRLPELLYRRGQLLLALDRRQEAAESFAKAADQAPEGAFYRQAAVKLAHKLRTGSR